MKIDKNIYGKKENGGSKILMAISVAVVAVIILVLGVLCWALPQPTYSEYERRDLVQMPKFSLESLFKGEYTANVELSFADTFAFREGFVRLKAMVQDARGIQTSGAIYGPVPGNTEDEEPSENTSSAPEESNPSNEETSEPGNENGSSESSSAPEVSEPEEPEEEIDDGVVGETVAGIYVYKNMGLELFGGSAKQAAYYASVVNKYREALPENVNIYNMVVPKHAEFALPKRFESLSKSQKASIDDIYSQLEGVTSVDAYSLLKEHSKEYIYFNTDHHWTGLGAYYAYTAFMDAAGLPYYDYADYTKHTIEDFRGTLYSGTQAESLYNNPDYVEWCEFPVEGTAYQYKKGDLENYYETMIMASYAKGVNAYGVYLGGDFPLTIVKTNVGNGRKCLIIKESYGNAPSTYIASGFDETYIVDERYYEGNIVDLVNERGITDVLILNNVSAANTSYHISNIENLLTQTYSGSIAYPEG